MEAKGTGLPRPNQLARVSYRPELDELVKDVEQVIAN